MAYTRQLAPSDLGACGDGKRNLGLVRSLTQPDSYQSSSASGLEAHRALDHASGGPNSLARASFPAGNGALMRIGTNQVTQ